MLFIRMLSILGFLVTGTLGATRDNYMDLLYYDILYDYRKEVRPVKRNQDVVNITLGSSLIRLIDLDEKSQVLTTNLWLELRWQDPKLSWEAAAFGNITKLHIPADYVWLPDILLYDNAAGDPQITILTDVTVYANGTVIWKPPAIYKSFCEIDIEYFPYDEQKCKMKFGAWTHTGPYVTMWPLSDSIKEIEDPELPGAVAWQVEEGMDLSYYYPSAEWDILSLVSRRHEQTYPGCCGLEYYIDITYYINLRRKHLFLTVNLVIPCILIAFLTTFVFYLSDHKMSFSIGILVSLTVFYLVLIDLIPPVSTVIPLIGKYLLFTMMLVLVSILITTLNINIKLRSRATHPVMTPWIRRLFLERFAKYLCFNAADSNENEEPDDSLEMFPTREETEIELPTITLTQDGSAVPGANIGFIHTPGFLSGSMEQRFVHSDRQPSPLLAMVEAQYQLSPKHLRKEIKCADKYRETSFDEPAPARAPRNPQQVTGPSHVMGESLSAQALRQHYIMQRLLANVNFISDHLKNIEEDNKVKDDWELLSHVIDRIFLILFTIANLAGTAAIILQAPLFRDSREPLIKPPQDNPLI